MCELAEAMKNALEKIPNLAKVSVCVRGEGTPNFGKTLNYFLVFLVKASLIIISFLIIFGSFIDKV